MKRLRSLRLERGLTQEELGRAVGVGKTTISQYENGVRTPDAEMLDRLASFFDVSVDYLLERTDNPYASTSFWNRDTPPTDVELESFLESANIHFNGAPLNDEDKEDILTYLRVKWEREKRKREKGEKS